jgi:penicillin-binding protein 2
MKRSRFSYDASVASHGKPVKLAGWLGRHENWVEAILPADADAVAVEGETNRRPLLALAVAMVVATVLLGGRMFALQVVEGKRNLGLADSQRIKQTIVRAPRGVIYDRDHNVLVRNEANFDLTVIPARLPKQAADRQKLYGSLGSLLGTPPGDIATAAESGGLDDSQPRLVVGSLDRDKALVFDQTSLDFPAFSLDVNPTRQYQDNGQLAQVLGYTGRVSPDDLKDNPTYLPTDYIGKLGIEKQYEDILRGISGQQQTEVDATGKPVRVLAQQQTTPGQSLLLTIDKGLEDTLTKAVQKQLDIAKSKGVGTGKGAAVAIDPRNGEVLALVSLPGYDDNLFSNGISSANYAKLASDPAQPLFDKATQGAYPTGSIIKPLVGSAALQEHVVTPDTQVNDTGALQVPNQYDPSVTYTFRSYEPGGFGLLNITRAIELSSNVFFYTMGGGFGNIAGLGVSRLTDYYHKFGLGAKTGIDLPDETAGTVPTPDWKQKTIGEPWVLGDTYNISVGQGDFRASPLQMANAIAAIANGGTLYKPHLVKQVLDDAGTVSQTIKPEVIRQGFISPQNNAVIRNAMRGVVSRGTACCLIEQQVPVHVAAKTGTAETDPTGNRPPHAWFEAYAPFEDAKIVIVVLVENSSEGAIYAAPAVRETLTWYFTQGAGAH